MIIRIQYVAQEGDIKANRIKNVTQIRVTLFIQSTYDSNSFTLITESCKVELNNIVMQYHSDFSEFSQLILAQ